jgi:hypothetical protein
MKLIFLLVSVAALLTTTGCLFPGHRGGGEYRDHGPYRGHGDYRGDYRSYPEPGVNVRIRAD